MTFRPLMFLAVLSIGVIAVGMWSSRGGSSRFALISHLGPCDPDGVDVAFSTSFSPDAPAAYRVSEAQVGDIAPECLDGRVGVTLRDNGIDLATGIATITGTTTTVSLAPTPLAEEVDEVYVEIVRAPHDGGGGPGPGLDPDPSPSPTDDPHRLPVPELCAGLALDVDVPGTELDDTLEGSPFNDLVIALSGHDRVRVESGGDCVHAGAGHDVVAGSTGADVLIGARGADRLAGGRGPDRLHGGTGWDRLRGRRGHDLMRGGRGNDILRGGPGRDLIFGGGGFDVCYGGARDFFRGCERVIGR